MKKVEYVLFREALTLDVPRGGEHEKYSLTGGPDTRYSSVIWELWFDESIACIVVGCKDEKTKEIGKTSLIPVVNCRIIRLEPDALPVEVRIPRISPDDKPVKQDAAKS